MSSRIRVATLQYYIRPIREYQLFEEQVRCQVETAADYRSRLIVFPEYFTTQLMSLGDTRAPIREQIDTLAGYEDRVRDLLASLARKHGIVIVGGSIPAKEPDGTLRNRCWILGPGGGHTYQDKVHMTRFEDEEWGITGSDRISLVETDFGMFATAICYDIEFPEIASVAAKNGANFVVTPSCTDDRQGFLRVRYCAHARAIENQLYVIHSGTVGGLPTVPGVSLNYGQAAILTPSDFSFARDGILAEGVPNQESMIIGELDLSLIENTRLHGTVLPLRDSQKRAEVQKMIDRTSL